MVDIEEYTPEQPVDTQIIAMAESFRPQIQFRAGKRFFVFTPITYQVQVTVGVYYRIRIEVDNGKNLIVTIHDDLMSDKGSLLDVKLIK